MTDLKLMAICNGLLKVIQ